MKRLLCAKPWEIQRQTSKVLVLVEITNTNRIQTVTIYMENQESNGRVNGCGEML